MANEHPDDSLEGIDLDLYANIDRLTEAFRAQRGRPGAKTAEAFAAAQDVPEALLLPALRAVETLDRGEGGLPAGATVGRFRIVGQLGRGGMGVVYEAAEEGLERSVALKVLDGAKATASFRSRFLREARAAARLAHPSIVPVYGTGADGPLLWYAMRKIEGRALDDLLAALAAGGEARSAAERSLLAAASADASPSASSESSSANSAVAAPRYVAIARIGQRLASALTYAHSEGVLHRDIKPGNVILDPSGQPHLTDFGLCKLEGDASLTEAADVIGTLRYMPPEALEGEADARGDVYGLGLILYELLGRTPAFARAGRAHLVNAIAREEPTPLRKLDPGVPRDLERIVAKAMAKLPEERYRTAGALAEDLQSFLSGKPIQARPLGTVYYLRLLVRRNRTAALAIAASLAALFAGASLYVVELRSLLEKAESARLDAERREALATLKFARTRLVAGDLGGAQELSNGIAPDQRGWAWQHLHGEISLPQMPRSLGLSRPGGATLMPSGDELLVFAPVELQVVDAGSLMRRTSLPVGRLDAIGVPTWGFVGAVPTGVERGVLAARSSQSGFGDAGTAQSHEILVWSGERGDAPRVIAAPAASPKHLAGNVRAGRAACIIGGELQLIDPVAGELSGRYALPGLSPVTKLAVLDDGQVVLGALAGEVALFDPRTETLTTVARHETKVTALATDGDRLIASGEAGGLIRFYADAAAGAHRQWCEVDGPITCMGLRGSNSLLVGLEGGRVAVVDLCARATIAARAYFISSPISVLETAPNGGSVIVSEWGRVQTWQPADQSAVRTVAASVGIAQECGVAPDESGLAFVSLDGHLHLIDERGALHVPCESKRAHARYRSDGAYVAAGGLVVDARTGADVLRWAPPSGECCAAVWSGDTLALLVWWTPEGYPVEFRRMSLWTWDSSEPATQPRHAGTVFDRSPYYRDPEVAALAGAPHLIVADASGAVIRLRLTDASNVWAYVANGDTNGCMAVDEERGLVVTAGGARGLLTFDLATGTPRERSFGDLSSIALRGARPIDLAIHGAAGRAATVTDQGVVQVWSWPAGEELALHRSGLERGAESVFCPSGDALYVTTQRGTVLRYGVGPLPPFCRGTAAFVDPREFVLGVLARLEGDASAEAWVAGLCTAAFVLDGEPDGARLAGDEPIARLYGRLQERGLEVRDVLRQLTGRADHDRDEFGRFGWAPRAALAGPLVR